LPLMAMLAHDASGVRASTTTAAAVLALAVVAGLVPLAAIMFALASSGLRGERIGAGRAIGRAVHAFPSFALLLFAMAAAEGVTVAIGVLAGELVAAWAQARLGEANAQELGVAAAAAFLPALALLAVLHDLARAAVVRLGARPVDALLAGVALMREGLWALVWSWAWRALAALAPLIAVAAVAERIGGRGGAALVTLGVLHQLVVLVRIALRTSWLAKALRSVDTITGRGSFAAALEALAAEDLAGPGGDPQASDR
jgi:hypothetical protein